MTWSLSVRTLIDDAALDMISLTSHVWNGDTIRSSRESTTMMDVSSASSVSPIGSKNLGIWTT